MSGKIAMAVLAVAGLAISGARSGTAFGAEAGDAGSLATEIAALKLQNEQLRALVPSQSHAMMDVAYHFTNLWFAAQGENWPLAQFYFNETRNHIMWAIRLVPVRKVASGELRLQDVFDGFDKAQLAELKQQIAEKNRPKFAEAYRAAASGCTACHAAAEKPFLHVVVPRQAEVQIIDMSGVGSRK